MAKTPADAVKTTQLVAQQLQKRRETYVKTLDALPMPKAKLTDFPYASMDQAIENNFALFDGGKDQAFRFLVKGFKAAAWRKVAEKNRAVRDDAAEGEIPKPLAARVVKAASQTS
jgi:hypothetical protein